ncbi:hypothetical protein ACN38_g2692 [Penicillium nordicum]|uniref:Zn(2)-C6 fungal-type domain-containing protein n=1 Tax=Penicillium nordicum TaxID=229535 RepID=A0A0M8P6E4_9EURO|nr:hypothetical protein ACN38_g2692 [Penicillium nordicum]
MMSCTPADSRSSPTDQVPRDEGDTQGCALEEDLLSQWNGRHENDIVATEKVSCDRCRKRKTRCDRVNPCSQCIKTGSQCTYQFGQKAKEKRQRVLISSVYESRMEHISNKIDDLSEMMRHLSHERSSNSNSGLATSAGMQPPLHSSLRSNESRVASSDNKTGATNHHQPLAEAGGIESTLFAHVIFATRFLQTVVANDPYSNVAAEMTSVLDALRSTVNVQKQQNETLEGSHPFSKALPPGLSSRDLPIPSMDRILACLRIAHERSSNEVYWPFEFGSLGDFTQYVIKACSPGPVTDMELIIVHYGLDLLFTECSSVTGNDAVKQEYEAQALICSDSLETILSSLPFHITTNIVSVCAMYMATTHCLKHGKPFAAWAFISRASLMAQALGLHSKLVMATEPTEEAQRGIRLFWALYVLEKAVSLRLGRSSTIRDHDITVPRLLLDRKMTSLLHNRLPDWIDMASLYGRVYDNIYSTSALSQPVSLRESRTRALAAELKRIMASRVEFYKRPNQWTSHVAHPGPSRFIIHANRAIEYSILASIYRGISSGKSSSLAPCPECISAARATLKETEVCITMLTDAALWSPSLDLWVNEIILLAPFMPFLILFCSVIETLNSSDMDQLQQLVVSLQSMAQSSRYSACSKQLRIFKALYDVAAKYVEAKAKGQSGEMISDPFTDLDMDRYLNGNTVWFGADSNSPGLFTAPYTWSLDGTHTPAAASSAGTTEDRGQRLMNQASSFQPRATMSAMQQQMPDDLELDTPGVQLGNWFHQSHQMMRLLDDS